MNEQEQFLSQLQQREADPGLVYRPSPEIISDTQTGFDGDGNYHVANGADMNGEAFFHDAQRPYRLAVDLNALLVRQCSEIAYTVTPLEREALIEDIVCEQMNEGAMTPEDAATARSYWFRIYGRRHE